MKKPLYLIGPAGDNHTKTNIFKLVFAYQANMYILYIFHTLISSTNQAIPNLDAHLLFCSSQTTAENWLSSESRLVENSSILTVKLKDEKEALKVYNFYSEICCPGRPLRLTRVSNYLLTELINRL